jgi:hypothetical protein
MSQFTIYKDIADVQSEVRTFVEVSSVHSSSQSFPNHSHFQTCESRQASLPAFCEQFDLSVERLIDGVNAYLKAAGDVALKKDIRDTVDDIDDLSVNIIELINGAIDRLPFVLSFVLLFFCLREY